MQPSPSTIIQFPDPVQAYIRQRNAILRGRKFPRSFAVLINGQVARGMWYCTAPNALAGAVNRAMTFTRSRHYAQVINLRSGRVVWEIRRQPGGIIEITP